MSTNEQVTVPRADVQYLLDVFIEYGFEAEDEEFINRLWNLLNE